MMCLLRIHFCIEKEWYHEEFHPRLFMGRGFFMFSSSNMPFINIQTNSIHIQ